MPKKFIIHGEPKPAPRMTRADRWKKRKCVTEYYEWAGNARRVVTGDSNRKLDYPPSLVIATFFLPIAQSTTGKMRQKIAGAMHNKKPDIDNLLKSVLDTLFGQDQSVSMVVGRKFFCAEGESPRTEIYLIDKDEVIDFELDVYDLFGDGVRLDAPCDASLSAPRVSDTHGCGVK